MAADGSDRDRPAPDARPAVAPPYLPIVVNDDEIQFQTGPWSGPVVTLADEDGEGCLGDLPELLDGRHRLVDLLDRFDPPHRPELGSAIERLYDEGIVTDVPATGADRIAGYLAVDPSVETVARPIASDVLVITTGAIGRMVAEDLGRLELDRVSLLTPPGARPIDEPRPASAVDRLPDDTPISEAIEDVDYLVYATDRPGDDLGRRINTLAFEAGLPWIGARLTGLDGQVGPAVVPGRSACYECYTRRAQTTLPRSYRDRGREADGVVPEPLRAHARILAGWLVTDFLRLAANGTGFTVGGVIHFDFFDMTVEPNPVLQLPRCPTCGTAERPRLDVKRFVDHDRLLEDDR